MTIANADGSIVLTTKVDDSGLKQSTRNLKSEAAKLADEYRKAGMSKSEAMKKAWQEVNKTRSETEKATKSTKEYGKQAQKSGGTAKKAFSGVGSSLKSLAVVAASAFSVYKLVEFGKEAVNLASDLQEVQNVVDVAFGEMSYKIEEFSKTAIDSFGISELTAKRTASTYMAMAKGMQFAEDVASDMAIMLTGLSADMASFYNITQEEARTALSAVYTGETETLKRYGILITEVNLEEYARQKGIEKSIAKMTQQEKVMLRYNYVLEATALAQGDFVRTQDSWANQTRVLKERWKEMQATFGETFVALGTLVLPVIDAIIEGLNKIAIGFRVVVESFGLLSNAETSTSATTNEQAENSQTTADNIGEQVENQKELNKELKKTTASFDTVEILSAGTAQEASAEPIIPEISGVDLGESLEIEETEKELSSLEKTIKKVVKKIQKYFEPLQNISLKNLKTSFDNLMISLTPYKDLVLAGLDWLWNDFLVPVSAWVVEDVLPRYLNLISEKLDLLSPAIDLIKDGLSWFWNDIIVPMGIWVVEDAVPSFIDMIAAALSVLTPIIEAIRPTLSWLWNSVITPMATFVGDAFTNFLGFLTEKFTNFSNWASENKETVRNIFDLTLGFLAGIWVYNTTKKILDFLPKLRTAFTNLGTKMAEGGLKGAFFAAAVGILAAGIISLSKNWDKMTPAERAITILGALAAAATAAAIAIGVFHTAWSVGVAAAAIAGGLALLGLSFAFSDTGDTGDAAKAAADNFYSSYDWDKDFPLPKLAKGTVVPPNKEFMAVLGDNTKEHEIVSPVSTMKQAFTEAMLEMGGNLGGGNTEVVLEIDGRELGRAVVEQGNRENRRIGTRLVIA